MPQMRSRREQVDAHRFITSRMNQALVLANPDSVERPLRRIGVSIFASVMIMVLIFGGFAIAALFNKGNDAPQPGHIIFEKDTNAIFVYTTKEGGDEGDLKLWPVANYTSALLLLEPYNGEPPTQKLKSSSLAGIPRGFLVGIDGAPPSPPDPESLLQDENWNACSMPREAGSIDRNVITQMVVQDMPEPEWLGDEQWLLARTAGYGVDDENATKYLLWNDRKFEVKDDSVLNALNLNASDAVPMTVGLLDTIAPGGVLEAKTEDYFFSESSDVFYNEVEIQYGQTVEASGELFVLLKENDAPQFAKVSETQEALLEAANEQETIEIDSLTKNEVGVQATYGNDNFPENILSDELWTVETDRPAVCGVFDPAASKDDAKVAIGMYRSAPGVLTDAAQGIELREDGSIVSNVENHSAQTVLPPGTAALVSSQAFPGQTIEGITYLVDSLGYRFGIVDKGTTGSTKQLLGYGDIDTVGVPDAMLNLIPRSADLDPTEAQKELAPDSEDVPVYESGESEEAAEEGGE